MRGVEFVTQNSLEAFNEEGHQLGGHAFSFHAIHPQRANGSICGNENAREKENIRTDQIIREIDADGERETALEIGYDHTAARIHR
jgi:hypothetical protein